MGKLFGTDGVRGVANTELTCELATKLGRAAAFVLTKHLDGRPKILIGKDTRISSSMLEMALAAGLCSFGADVVLVGYLPTPALAYLTVDKKADAGVMISASHNPCEYNGIKIFNAEGYKLSDEIENEIEDIILGDKPFPNVPVGADLGRVETNYEYVNDYINHIIATVDPEISFKGLKIALDCANGAASDTAEKIFSHFGCECHVLSNTPDGVNINKDCGSTHLGALQNYVKENKMDLGLAFDGDSDRCLAVDENGEIVDGDKCIAIFAKILKEEGRLNGNTAVVTVMTNIGFKRFAKEEGINIAETTVGDRYVLEEMLKNDYVIGGEQSGHIIFKEFATTGDGQLSGVQLAAVMAKTKKRASELANIMQSFPQVLVNVTVANDKKGLVKTDEEIVKSIKNAEEVLGENGRILVRASGTEPLIRVMIEGQNTEEIGKLANDVADVIRERTK